MVISRVYDPDGLLSQVAVTNPDGSVDVYELLWDRALPVPQVVMMSVNGDTTSFTYGVNRAQAIDSVGVAASFGYSVLGDVTAGPLAVAGAYDPYGQPDADNVIVGFGYRGELHVGDTVYLRFRDHVPGLGRFLTSDPLPGMAGATIVVNGYAYAANDPIQFQDPFGLRAVDGTLGLPVVNVRRKLRFSPDFADRFTSLGRLEVAGFIPGETSELLGVFGLYEGDDRDFSTDGAIPTDRSRFFASIDFATSEVFAQVNPTCSVDGECFEAWPIVLSYLYPWHSIGTGYAQQFSEFAFYDSSHNDSFSLRWSVAHGDRRLFSGLIPTEFVRPSFDGELSIRWLSEESLEVRYDGDCFPSVEAHLILENGRRIRVMEFSSRGSFFGIPILPNCHNVSTGQVS